MLPGLMGRLENIGKWLAIQGGGEKPARGNHSGAKGKWTGRFWGEGMGPGDAVIRIRIPRDTNTVVPR